MAALLPAISMISRLRLHREIPDVRCENEGRGADSGLECRVLGIKKRKARTMTTVKKVHPCTGTEVLYRPYGPWGE